MGQPPRRLGWPAWLLALLCCAALTVGATYLVNRYLQGALSSLSDRRTLRVMTWNIGKIYLPLDSRAGDKDLDHVAQVIREVDPQIVCLQELKGPEQLGRLLTKLGRRWRGKIPEDRYDRRAALLTRLEVEAFVELKTSTGRTAQGAEISLPGGTRATVTSLHLDAFDPERRLRQAEEILAAITKVGHDDIIVAGDFNVDAAAARMGSPDQRLYAMLSKELVDAGERAGGTTLTSQRLDYVFFRSRRVKGQTARVLRDNRIGIMDHDPLVVDMVLRPRRAIQ